MTVVPDANVAIAVLNPADPFHESALKNCVESDEMAILNITRAEALIHPTRLGKDRQADAELDNLGFVTYQLDDQTADRARQLRAEHGNRNFPMVDAVVVAFGLERDWPILTGDAKWPTIAEATIRRL